MTQLVFEVVTTVLFLVDWLPSRIEGDPGIALRARIRRTRDLVLAIFAGVGLAALSYAMLTPAPQSSPFFLDGALPEGGGTNVINVMLVDVRSLELALSYGHAAAQTFIFRPRHNDVALDKTGSLRLPEDRFYRVNRRRKRRPIFGRNAICVPPWHR
jgi:hypothetical protein